ncbi:hypothetical protein BZG36_00222 [Bifiguratus adelaidae]|uniref:Kinesin motor domain-containing protein n=1 Tax=Bifiguratus adelaidae TaxID=1938954 RepID=A0A261Y8T3_9FUNG|nr:hypothetical protein BZG36_00222 [Bifiguratus adelaidae]
MKVSHLEAQLLVHSPSASHLKEDIEFQAQTSLTCGDNVKCVLIKDLRSDKEASKLYLDKCIALPLANGGSPMRATAADIVNRCLTGYNAALFVFAMGTFRYAKYNRMDAVITTLELLSNRLKSDTRSISISYSFLGISDKKCVNLLNDRIVQGEQSVNGVSRDRDFIYNPAIVVAADIVAEGIEHTLESVDSVDSIIDKVKLGSSMPFAVSIRLEGSGEMKDGGFIGNIIMFDLGSPRFDTMSILPADISQAISNAPALHSSFAHFASLCQHISQPGYMGDLPYEKTIFTSLAADYVGGSGKSYIIGHVEGMSQLSSSELALFTELLSLMRKIKVREVPNVVDKRVDHLEKKYRYYKEQYWTLHDQSAEHVKIYERSEKSMTLKLSNLNAQLQEVSASRSKLVSEKEVMIASLRAELSELESERQSKQEEMDISISAVTTGAQYKIAVLKMELVTAKEAMRELRLALSESDDDRHDALIDKERLAEEDRKYEIDLEELKEKLAELQGRYTRSREMIIELKEKLGEASTSGELLNEEISKLQANRSFKLPPQAPRSIQLSKSSAKPMDTSRENIPVSTKPSRLLADPKPARKEKEEPVRLGEVIAVKKQTAPKKTSIVEKEKSIVTVQPASQPASDPVPPDVIEDVEPEPTPIADLGPVRRLGKGPSKSRQKAPPKPKQTKIETTIGSLDRLNKSQPEIEEQQGDENNDTSYTLLQKKKKRKLNIAGKGRTLFGLTALEDLSNFDIAPADGTKAKPPVVIL